MSFFERYRDWLHGPTCGAALRYHLEHVALGDFKPWAKALETQAKVQAIEGSRSDVDRWLADLAAGAMQTLLPDLATSQQVLSEHERLTGGRSRLSVGGMGRALAVRFTSFAEGDYVYVHGQGARYWILRNHEKWLRAKPVEARRYLEGLTPKELREVKY